MTFSMTIQGRLERLMQQRKVGNTQFCLCGNYIHRCKYHRADADPVMKRAADLWALIDQHHEIDYDTCSTNEQAVIEDIAVYLRGEDEYS